MIYKFTAEHMSRSTVVYLVRELEDKDIDVEHAEMDQVFSNQMTMIVTVDEAVATTVRARIWELNNGAACDMDIITAEEMEAYF